MSNASMCRPTWPSLWQLIVNELVANVVKHVGPPCEIGLHAEVGDTLKLTVSDTGQGPPQNRPHTGLGTRIVDAFITQLGARMETRRLFGGYSIELTVPLPPTKL